jgi:hypothetical protein
MTNEVVEPLRAKPWPDEVAAGCCARATRCRKRARWLPGGDRSGDFRGIQFNAALLK